jgi:hypothetical protein
MTKAEVTRLENLLRKKEAEELSSRETKDLVRLSAKTTTASSTPDCIGK